MIDATEFTDLVEQHRAQALSVANAVLHHSDLAHDVVADALMLAWIHRTQFRNDGPFVGWFMRIVKNRALEWRRKQLCRPATYQFDAELPLWQLDSGHNIEKAMITRERNAQVRYTVRRMPPLLRTPIRLVYWDGLGCDAAAERLEISRDAFKSRMFRSKRMFREKWLGGRMSGRPHLVVSIPPPARSVLVIRDLMRLESPDPAPNRWWRFWHWTLLGWRWERLP